MRKIKFELNETSVYGDLDLENRHIILDLNTYYELGQTDCLSLDIYNSILKELKNYFYENHQFDIFGEFDDNVKKVEDLTVGMTLPGIVTNMTNFGAFVDIGLKNDGLIHISQMSDKRIAHPLEVLSINQQLSHIRVIEVDKEKGKVALSLR